jgi:LmbE family N-acetylglucosaminyl deacetylase
VSKPTLMAVFAHPDDEAFGSGGSLAKYAAEGCDVYLVTATRGEAGQIAEPDLASQVNLPFVREQELRCACRIYGMHSPIFMEYVDGQLTQVHQGQAVARLVRILRELKPQVLLTFGPEGIYGHYDHLAVHRWATIAVELAADPEWFPEQLCDTCHPHQVSKLYFRTLTQEQVAAMAEAEDGKRAAVMMDDVPFYFVGRKPEEITTVVDVTDFVQAKLDGIRCHATQIGRRNRFADTPDEVMHEIWFCQESYILAHSTVGWPQTVETDLLAGLR